MKKLGILLLLILTTSGCADPTRLITNKPKPNEQKQKEREQRRQEDKAATEALKSFKISDHTDKETKQSISKEESRTSSKDSQYEPAENTPENPSTQPEKK